MQAGFFGISISLVFFHEPLGVVPMREIDRVENCTAVSLSALILFKQSPLPIRRPAANRNNARVLVGNATRIFISPTDDMQQHCRTAAGGRER